MATILVIEDEESLRSLIVRFLRGHTVLQAATRAEAEALAAANMLDLIICDGNLTKVPLTQAPLHDGASLALGFQVAGYNVLVYSTYAYTDMYCLYKSGDLKRLVAHVNLKLADASLRGHFDFDEK